MLCISEYEHSHVMIWNSCWCCFVLKYAYIKTYTYTIYPYHRISQAIVNYLNGFVWISFTPAKILLHFLENKKYLAHLQRGRNRNLRLKRWSSEVLFMLRYSFKMPPTYSEEAPSCATTNVFSITHTNLQFCQIGQRNCYCILVTTLTS